MSHSFSKDELDEYLKALSSEYKKRNRLSTHVEIIIVGGASVLLNYGFRDSTTDVDAIILADSVMREAIIAVSNKYNLPPDWINTNFRKTASYSDKLAQYSHYYKTFSNVVEIRTIDSEYLIAMKLVAGRRYKNDLSDVIGILSDSQSQGNIITFDDINKAVIDLYDDWSKIDDYSKNFLLTALNISDLSKLYNTISQDEDVSRNIIVEINDKYPNVVNIDNVNDVIDKALNKKRK